MASNGIQIYRTAERTQFKNDSLSQHTQFEIICTHLIEYSLGTSVIAGFIIIRISITPIIQNISRKQNVNFTF